MIYIALSVICVLFVELSIQLGLSDTIKKLLGLTWHAVGVLFSQEYSDPKKEVMIRQASLDLYKVTSVFIAKFTAVLLGIYFAYLLFAQILQLSEGEFIASLYSVKVILLLTLVSVVYVRLRHVVVQRLLSS